MLPKDRRDARALRPRGAILAGVFEMTISAATAADDQAAAVVDTVVAE
jgi:hypothetical protein